MSDVAKCPLCQKYIDITFNPETCPQCGGNLTSQNLKPEARGQYYGVGGWLLLLCIGMTILGPFLSLMAIAREVTESNKISAYIPEIETAVKIEAAFTIILISLSIYAGISLWAIRPKAVLKAKLYLILLPILSILSIFLTESVLPQSVKDAFIRESIYPLIRTVLYAVFWFLYLSNSQRVAETYADQ